MTAARQARDDAARASADARIEVRALDEGTVGDAVGLLTRIWGVATVEAPMMIALSHAGNYVGGAFDADRLVGVCVGFFAAPRGEVLHSHVTAIEPGLGRRGIGMALKLDQRAWCLERGIERITWTFDPLVARNAAFNLTRLGADIAEYLVDFYGEMNDGVNAGQGSDRLLANWRVARALPPASSLPAGAPPWVADLGGEPVVSPPGDHDRVVTIAVPADVETLRREQPDAAVRWRRAVRDALSSAVSDGWRVTGFGHHRYYLERKP